jgi:hypothetical protein
MVEEREAVSIKEEEEDVVVGIKTEEEEDEESIKMEEEQEEEELQTDQTLLQPPHVSSADVLVFEGELHQVQSGLLQSTSTTSELGLSTNIRSSNIRSKCIQKREFEREN